MRLATPSSSAALATDTSPSVAVLLAVFMGANLVHSVRTPQVGSGNMSRTVMDLQVRDLLLCARCAEVCTLNGRQCLP